jgi:molybdate transport system substrate-binding protein
MRRFGTLASLLVCLAVAGGAAGEDGNAAPKSKMDAPPREVAVFAAASLREVFEKLAKDFEAERPGDHVALQLAGSQELRTQIENGARADVFASADTRHMKALADAKLVAESAIFAQNEPVVVVPTANPAGVERFEDLTKAKRLVIGTPEVPIGNYTNQILANAGKTLGEKFQKDVEAAVVSRELNVRQILAKIGLGEGDAGFVYRTDAMTAKDRVRVVEIPAALNVVAQYPIAAVSGSPHPDLANAWVTFVLSKRGQAALREAGFKSVER